MTQSCFCNFLETPRIGEWPEETWGRRGCGSHLQDSHRTQSCPGGKVLERISSSLILGHPTGGPEALEGGRSQRGP